MQPIKQNQPRFSTRMPEALEGIRKSCLVTAPLGDQSVVLGSTAEELTLAGEEGMDSSQTMSHSGALAKIKELKAIVRNLELHVSKRSFSKRANATTESLWRQTGESAPTERSGGFGTFDPNELSVYSKHSRVLLGRAQLEAIGLRYAFSRLRVPRDNQRLVEAALGLALRHRLSFLAGLTALGTRYSLKYRVSRLIRSAQISLQFHEARLKADAFGDIGTLWRLYRILDSYYSAARATVIFQLKELGLIIRFRISVASIVSVATKSLMRGVLRRLEASCLVDRYPEMLITRADVVQQFESEFEYGGAWSGTNLNSKEGRLSDVPDPKSPSRSDTNVVLVVSGNKTIRMEISYMGDNKAVWSSIEEEKRHEHTDETVSNPSPSHGARLKALTSELMDNSEDSVDVKCLGVDVDGRPLGKLNVPGSRETFKGQKTDSSGTNLRANHKMNATLDSEAQQVSDTKINQSRISQPGTSQHDYVDRKSHNESTCKNLGVEEGLLCTQELRPQVIKITRNGVVKETELSQSNSDNQSLMGRRAMLSNNSDKSHQGLHIRPDDNDISPAYLKLTQNIHGHENGHSAPRLSPSSSSNVETVQERIDFPSSVGTSNRRKPSNVHSQQLRKASELLKDGRRFGGMRQQPRGLALISGQSTISMKDSRGFKAAPTKPFGSGPHKLIAKKLLANPQTSAEAFRFGLTGHTDIKDQPKSTNYAELRLQSHILVKQMPHESLTKEIKSLKGIRAKPRVDLNNSRLGDSINQIRSVNSKPGLRKEEQGLKDMKLKDEKPRLVRLADLRVTRSYGQRTPLFTPQRLRTTVGVECLSTVEVLSRGESIDQAEPCSRAPRSRPDGSFNQVKQPPTRRMLEGRGLTNLSSVQSLHTMPDELKAKPKLYSLTKEENKISFRPTPIKNKSAVASKVTSTRLERRLKEGSRLFNISLLCGRGSFLATKRRFQPPRQVINPAPFINSGPADLFVAKKSHSRSRGLQCVPKHKETPLQGKMNEPPSVRPGKKSASEDRHGRMRNTRPACLMTHSFATELRHTPHKDQPGSAKAPFRPVGIHSSSYVLIKKSGSALNVNIIRGSHRTKIPTRTDTRASNVVLKSSKSYADAAKRHRSKDRQARAVRKFFNVV